MSSDEIYLDAAAICEAYEKEAKFSFTRNSALITLSANIGIANGIIGAAENAMNQMPRPDAPRPNEPNVEQPQGVESAQAGANSCDEGNVDIPFIGEEVNLIEETEGSLPSMEDALSFIGLPPSKEVKETLDECYNCNLRADFDWQLKPLNLMSELNKLVDQLALTADQILESLEPFDLVKSFCDLRATFNVVCLADWTALLLAWEGLLASYFGELIRISLNWTFLIGPFIKYLIDAAATFADVIRRALSAPLDCFASFLKTLIRTRDATLSAAEGTAAFGESIPKYFEKKNWIGKYEQQNATLDEEAVESQNYLKSFFGKEPGFIRGKASDKNGIPLSFDFSLNDTNESYYKKRKAKKAFDRQKNKKREHDTYWDKQIAKAKKEYTEHLESFDGLFENLQGSKEEKEAEESRLIKAFDEKSKRLKKEIQEKKKEKDTKPGWLERTLMWTNQAKEHINNLFANLLLCLKSFNNWIVGSLDFSVAVTGKILMLLDFVKLINGIINAKSIMDKQEGGGLESLCKLVEENPDRAKDLLNSWFGDVDPAAGIQRTRDSVAEAMEDFKNFEDGFCSTVNVTVESDDYEISNVDVTIDEE